MEPHDFWQAFEPAQPRTVTVPPSYVTEMPDGRRLRLPIRLLPNQKQGLASLIINQASFVVLDALADALASKLSSYRPDIIVGLPTLGLTLAAAVAVKLGHERYVPLGFSRKFWYDEELSVPVSSITTPDQQKKLYLDPRMLPLLEGPRVVLVDDVISSGRSIRAALSLLARRRIEPVAIGAAMLQSDRWLHSLKEGPQDVTGCVEGVLQTPLLQLTASGDWQPADENGAAS
ncbi:phosphoribosyltransferase [Oryzifoliimicrobium ureilyticus]|uniref:phosphoribosyltransferase n=1 Tax=Oryzifoliimicrobium ureilyticus TaxID=3113724 RepID=UPI003F66BFA1